MLRENLIVFVYTCENDIIRRHIQQYHVDGIVTNYLLWTQEKLRDTNV